MAGDNDYVEQLTDAFARGANTDGQFQIKRGANAVIAEIQHKAGPALGRAASRSINRAIGEFGNDLNGALSAVNQGVGMAGSAARELEKLGRNIETGVQKLQNTFQAASDTVEGARGAARTVQNLAHGVGVVFTWLNENKAEEPAANEERYAAGDHTPAGPDEPGPAIMASSPPSGPGGP